MQIRTSQSLKSIILFILISTAALCFSGCLSIDTTINLEENGSGTVQLEYRVSQMVINLGVADEDTTILPLPVGERDFQNSVDRIDGLELLSFSTSENEDIFTINAELSFSDIKALNDFFANGENLIQFEADGSGTTYRQVITSGINEPIDEETNNFINSFFREYELRFNLHAPKQIQSANIGTISSDNRFVEYSISIPELLQAQAPITWELSW